MGHASGCHLAENEPYTVCGADEPALAVTAATEVGAPVLGERAGQGDPGDLGCLFDF